MPNHQFIRKLVPLMVSARGGQVEGATYAEIQSTLGFDFLSRSAFSRALRSACYAPDAQLRMEHCYTATGRVYCVRVASQVLSAVSS